VRTAPHYYTHTLPHALPHTAARTAAVAHCHTLRSALPQTVALPDSRTLPRARAAIYCQAHYHVLSRALHIPCVTAARIATHNQALAPHSHTIPHTAARTAARSALPQTAAHSCALPHCQKACGSCGRTLPSVLSIIYYQAHKYTLPRVLLPHTAARTITHCRTAPQSQIVKHLTH
jgi:hypothetical protein